MADPQRTDAAARTLRRLVTLPLAILLGFCVAITLCYNFGCAAPGARQGTAEVEVAPEVALVAQAAADVRAAAAVVADQSTRMVEAVQAGGDAKIDQSTADKWVNRALALGLVLTLLTYPVGKIIWLIVGAGLRATGRARSPPNR